MFFGLFLFISMTVMCLLVVEIKAVILSNLTVRNAHKFRLCMSVVFAVIEFLIDFKKIRLNFVGLV